MLIFLREAEGIIPNKNWHQFLIPSTQNDNLTNPRYSNVLSCLYMSWAFDIVDPLHNKIYLKWC